MRHCGDRDGAVAYEGVVYGKGFKQAGQAIGTFVYAFTDLALKPGASDCRHCLRAPASCESQRHTNERIAASNPSAAAMYTIMPPTKTHSPIIVMRTRA